MDCEKCGEPMSLIDGHNCKTGENVSNSALSDELCAQLSLMVDIFNSCIEAKVLPRIGSPCQKRILKLLKQIGRKPSASK